MNRKVEVSYVVTGGYADKQGIKVGDRIIKSCGSKIDSSSDINKILWLGSKKSENVHLTIQRADEEFDVEFPGNSPYLGMEYNEVVEENEDQFSIPGSDVKYSKKGISRLKVPAVIAVLAYTALYYFYDNNMIENAEGLLHDNGFPEANVLRADFPMLAPLNTKANIDIVVEQEDRVDAVVMKVFGNPFYSNNIYVEISGPETMKLNW